MTVCWELDPVEHGRGVILRAAAKALRRTVLALEGFVKVTLTGQRHGRVYRRKGRVHVASAPGEPPAVDTGFLRGSIMAARDVRQEGDTLVGEVQVGAEYGICLEKGTRRMAPRPFAERTLKDRWGEITGYFYRLFWGYLG